MNMGKGWQEKEEVLCGDWCAREREGGREDRLCVPTADFEPLITLYELLKQGTIIMFMRSSLLTLRR